MDFLEKDLMISQIFQPRLGNLRYTPKSSVRAPSVRAAPRFLTLEDIDKKAMEQRLAEAELLRIWKQLQTAEEADLSTAQEEPAVAQCSSEAWWAPKAGTAMMQHCCSASPVVSPQLLAIAATADR